MRIAIDVGALGGPQGGMRVYLEQLLPRLAAFDRENDYLMHLVRWGDPAGARAAIPALPNPRFRPLVSRVPYRLLMNLEHRLGLPVTESLLLPKVDLYHGACQVVPPLRRTRSVVTIHHHEELRLTHKSDWDQFYYVKVHHDSLRRADRIIADSKYTRRYILEKFGLPEEKITVVYHGIFDPKPSFSEADLAALRARYGLPERFVVCVSHMHQRKNTVRLVRAFARLGSEAEGAKLALVGGGQPAYIAEVKAAAEAAGIAGRVVFTGPVPHAEVAAFFAAAQLFCLPSLLEGFGIPLIEAMAMGCPVAGADATAIPEVIGDAGLIFDPEDEAAIAGAMSRALSDAALRADLKRRGLARAAMFSWDEAARRTLAVYREALA